MEAYAKCPWGYVEPSLSVTVLVIVGAGWAGCSWVRRVAGVLSQPQAKDGKLAVQETHKANMSLGGMLSSTQKKVSAKAKSNPVPPKPLSGGSHWSDAANCGLSAKARV